MLGVTPDDRGLWLLSSRGRDRAALVRVDLATGTETLVHEDPRLDVEGVAMNPEARQPLAAFTFPGHPAIHFLNHALESDLAGLRPPGPAGLVKGPMLLIHGARDPRVNVRESQQMATALEQAGKKVRLVVFSDEGHRREYGNWRNAIRHYREVEDFLAACLGGRRSSG
jgi:pimeloyl-ACP methyl ester carboxylesterase